MSIASKIASRYVSASESQYLGDRIEGWVGDVMQQALEYINMETKNLGMHPNWEMGFVKRQGSSYNFRIYYGNETEWARMDFNGKKVPDVLEASVKIGDKMDLEVRGLVKKSWPLDVRYGDVALEISDSWAKIARKNV